MKLSEALEAVPLAQCVPMGNSPAWKQASNRLSQLLKDRGLHVKLRSWRKLWTLLHHSPCPRFVSWQQLLGDATVGRLAASARDSMKETGVRIDSWNARWMKDAHAPNNDLKKNVVLNRCLKGRIVCLQETHWFDADALIWKNAFPACTLVWSPAREGTRAGPQGGTAILVPPGMRVLSTKVLAKGYGVEAVIQPSHTEEAVRVVSLYAPPDRKLEALQDISAALTSSGHPTYLTGDLNVEQIGARSPAEQRRSAVRT